MKRIQIVIFAEWPEANDDTLIGYEGRYKTHSKMKELADMLRGSTDPATGIHVSDPHVVLVRMPRPPRDPSQPIIPRRRKAGRPKGRNRRNGEQETTLV